MLELGVVPLWLDQATLLDVWTTFREAICAQWSQGTAASGLGVSPLTPVRPLPQGGTEAPVAGPGSANTQHCPPRSPACGGWVVLVSGDSLRHPFPLQLHGLWARGSMQGQKQYTHTC